MGAEGSREHGKPAAFAFDFRECHAPDVPAGGWADSAQFLDQLRARGWEPQGEGDPSRSCDPDVQSIDDLMDRVRAFFVDEQGQPDEVAQVPFDKLAALLGGGWSFVGGDFTEFEGNHNDSQIVVVLRRAQGS